MKSTEYGTDSQSVSNQQKEDMIGAIDHKKSNAGLDVLLSFGLGF